VDGVPVNAEAASAEKARKILRKFTALAGHEFWKEGQTLRDRSRFADLSKLPSSATTAVSLLGLAISSGEKLAAFDQKIPAGFVVDGSSASELIPAQ